MTIAVAEKQEQSASVESQAKALFKQGLYLQAKSLCETNWGDIQTWQNTEQLKIAVTLYNHLGGERNSEALSLKMYRQDPKLADNIVQQWYYVLNKEGCILAEAFYEQTKEQVSTDVQNEDRVAFEAILLRQFHDFERAETLLEQGLEKAENKTWFEVMKVGNLVAQEEFEQAYHQSRALYQAKPRINTLRSYFNATQHFKGLESAVEVYLQELPRFESASMWLDCATRLADLLKWPECEQALAHYERLKFADDRWDRRTYSSLKGQVLLSKGEYEQGKAVLENCKQYYWQTVSKNIAAYNESHDPNEAFQSILDVPFYRQKHLTCAPTTMAAIAQYLGKSFDSEAIAEDICFAGTPDTKERQWLRDNDFHFVEFELQQAILVKLIDLGIPFAFCTTSGFTGHMQAVIGYNLKYGSMYIMDPSSPAMQEMLIKESIEKEAFLGGRCLAFVPMELKHKLDFIDTVCSRLYPIYDRYRLAKNEQDVSGMQQAIEEMKAVDADHRMTVFAIRDQACFYNDDMQIQVGNEKLLAIAPKETMLLNSQYYCVRDRGERALAISQLTDYLEQHHDLDLTETLFNEICDTNENPELVAKLLLKLKRTGYTSASIYDSIANYYWSQQAFQQAHKYYFVSYCMDDTNAKYVENYFKASNVIGKKDQAIQWLVKRCDKYLGRSSSPAISLYQAYCAVNQDAQGLKVLEHAMTIHPQDTQLIATLAKAYGDTGKTEQLESLLSNNKHVLSERRYKQLMAKLKQTQGLMGEASGYYQQLYESSPFLSEIATPYFRSLNKLGESDKLNDEIERLIASNPDTPKVYFYAADWHSNAEYLAGILERGIETRPDNWYLRESQIQAYLRLNQYGKALALAKEAVAHLNDGTYQNAALARCYYYNEDFELALSTAYKVLAKDIDNETALWVLTVTCASPEDKLASLERVKEQLKLQHSVNNGVWHYWQEGQHVLSEEVLKDYIDTLLSQYENDWFSYCIASQFYAHFNHLDEAVAVMEIGQNKFPLVPRMHSEQGANFLALGDLDSAISCNEQALSINPAWDSVAQRLAELHEKKGNIERAVEVIRNCLAHNAQDGILHGYCTDYLIQLGDKEQALKHIVSAIRFHTDYPWAWEQLKALSSELGQTHVADDLANELVKHQGHLAASWRFKTYLAEERQHKVQYLQHAIDCDVMDESSYSQLADIYTRHGEFKQAIEVFSNTPWGDALPVGLAKSKAELLSNTGELEQGAKELWTAIRNDSGNNQLWQKLYGMYHQLIEHDDNLKAQFKEQIIEVAERQIQLDPHQPGALCVAAEQILAYGDKTRGTEILKRSYELAPSDEYIMLTYSDRLIEMEQFQDALKCLTDYEQFSIVSFALARKVNVLTHLGEQDEALATFKVLLANQCDIYGTVLHAFNALSRVMEKSIMIDLLAAQLENCSKMQANLWADKFLENTGRRGIKKLLQEIDSVQSAFGWAGAFSGLLDFWQENNEIPDNDIVNANIARIHQDSEVVARLVDVNVQSSHLYNAVHIMDSFQDKSALPMVALYQYAICLLMLGRGDEASGVIAQGLQAEPDHTLHNLLVWHHADTWIQSNTIAAEELSFIDKAELIEAEDYIVSALELMSKLDEEVELSAIGEELKDLRSKYSEVSGLSSCDTFHSQSVKFIRSRVKKEGFWQNLLTWIAVR